MGLHKSGQIQIADKFVEHDAFTEDLPMNGQSFHGTPISHARGAVHPAEHLLDRKRRRDPKRVCGQTISPFSNATTEQTQSASPSR